MQVIILKQHDVLKLLRYTKNSHDPLYNYQMIRKKVIQYLIARCLTLRRTSLAFKLHHQTQTIRNKLEDVILIISETFWKSTTITSSRNTNMNIQITDRIREQLKRCRHLQSHFATNSCSWYTNMTLSENIFLCYKDSLF